MLLCRPGKRQSESAPVAVRILAEEIGYNALSREHRTILIERPLVAPRRAIDAEAQPAARAAASFRAILAPLSPRSAKLGQLAKKQRARLISLRKLHHHDECAKYLECISQELTLAMEAEVKRMQSNYMILSRYLEDVASRTRALAERFVEKYERAIEQSQMQADWLCEIIRRSIRVSVENHVVHLLHGKLMAAIQKCHEKEDRELEAKFEVLLGSRLTLCQLGAQQEFANFILSDELLWTLRQLPDLQSPVAMLSCLVKLADLMSEGLSQSVQLQRLLGQDAASQGKAYGRMLPPPSKAPTSICSDDLIATFVYCLPRARPNKLFSLIKYLELFGWSSVERDQASYYLATLESAVAYTMSFGLDHRERAMPESGEQCGASQAIGDEAITLVRCGAHHDDTSTSDHENDGTSDLVQSDNVRAPSGPRRRATEWW